MNERDQNVWTNLDRCYYQVSDEERKAIGPTYMSTKMTEEIIKGVEESFVGTLAQISAEKDRLIDIAQKQCKANSDKLRAIEDKRQEQFKEDLFHTYGVSDNPKREKAYSKAYERGHSAGYTDIAVEFADLVELIK